MAAPPSRYDVREESFQNQLAQFELLLHSHVEKMAHLCSQIEPSFPQPEPCGYTAIEMGTEVDEEDIPTHQLRPLQPTEITQTMRFNSDAMELEGLSGHLDRHNRHLGGFLKAHIDLVNELRLSLSAEGNSPPPVSFTQSSVETSQTQGPASILRPNPADSEKEQNEIRSYAQQFSVIVVFSTFVAGVIIAYLQLMNDILPPLEKSDLSATLHRQMGFGMGFAGLVWNLAIAIVAGADTAACASGYPWRTIEGIRSRFAGFLFAQFFGFVIFGTCIGVLLYPVHFGRGLVALPMAIFPAAVFIAGVDISSTSEEFRALKADVKTSISTFCRRVVRCPCGGPRRRRS